MSIETAEVVEGVLSVVTAGILLAMLALAAYLVVTAEAEISRQEAMLRAWEEQPRPFPAVYPLTYELRRTMVLEQMANGTLTLTEARAFVTDGTLSADEYRMMREAMLAKREAAARIL